MNLLARIRRCKGNKQAETQTRKKECGIKIGRLRGGMRGAYAKRFSGDAPPAALRFSVGFRSVRLLRRAPVYGGAERRRLYIIYGRTSQGQTRTKPYVNRISTASEKSCRNEVISGQFSGEFTAGFLERFRL